MRCLKLLVLGLLLLVAVVGVGSRYQQVVSDTALMDAVAANDAIRAQAVLARGGVSRSIKTAALRNAIDQRHPRIAYQLIKAGARLDEVRMENGMSSVGRGICQDAPLIWMESAILYGDLESVKLLERLGVRCDGGESPLLRAVYCRKLPIVAYLIQHGEDVNARGAAGETPLAMAVNRRAVGIARLLLRHGAREDIRDMDGRSLFTLAKLRGDAALARELRAAGSPR